MRTHTTVCLVGLLAIQSCSDAGGPPDDLGGLPVSATAQITTTTTGLELDPDGFRVIVDGRAVGTVASNGILATKLDPGSHAIGLTGVSRNCTIDGTGSRTLSVREAQVVTVEFAVVCTAMSGVVGVVVDVSGPSGSAAFEAILDEGRTWIVTPGYPSYLAGVVAGEHGVSLRAPPYCAVETDVQPVRMTVGEVVRDTVEVHFPAICTPSWAVTGTVRITAPTTGATPSSTPYSVLHEHFGYWDYGGPVSNLGTLEPGGSLIIELEASDTSTGADPYWNDFYLEHVPANCKVRSPTPYPLPGFTITPAETLDVEVAVTCTP